MQSLPTYFTPNVTNRTDTGIKSSKSKLNKYDPLINILRINKPSQHSMCNTTESLFITVFPRIYPKVFCSLLSGIEGKCLNVI